MSTKTTPPDNKMRLVAMDDYGKKLLYIEGTITATGIRGVSETTIVDYSGGLPEPKVLNGGSVALACHRGRTKYYATWVEQIGGGNSDRRVVCSGSANGGATWGVPVTVYTADMTNFPGDVIYCLRIQVDSHGHIYIAYHWFHYEGVFGSGTAHYDTHVHKSTDGGATWSTITLTDTYPGCDLQIDSSDNIYILYLEKAGVDLYCRKSTDGGETFGAAVLVTPGSWNCNDGEFKSEIDNADNIHVIYHSTTLPPYNGVGYCCSRDGGASFGGLVHIALHQWYQYGEQPQFTVDGNDINCFWWYDSEPERLYCAKSNNGGASWFNTKIFTPTNGDLDIRPDKQGPQGALYDGSTLLYVYGGSGYGNYPHVGSVTSGDGGSNWTQAGFLVYGVPQQEYHTSLATYFGIGIAAARTYFLLA